MTNKYLFFIMLVDGNKVEWIDLSMSLARQMYTNTAKSKPDNILRFGWHEVG